MYVRALGFLRPCSGGHVLCWLLAVGASNLSQLLRLPALHESRAETPRVRATRFPHGWRSSYPEPVLLWSGLGPCSMSRDPWSKSNPSIDFPRVAVVWGTWFGGGV